MVKKFELNRIWDKQSGLNKSRVNRLGPISSMVLEIQRSAPIGLDNFVSGAEKSGESNEFYFKLIFRIYFW